MPSSELLNDADTTTLLVLVSFVLDAIEQLSHSMINDKDLFEWFFRDKKEMHKAFKTLLYCNGSY